MLVLMSPYSERSKQWREKNKEFIVEWQKKVDDLRNLGNLENWTYERLEIEIAQQLPSNLRKIYDFALSYIRRYKTGRFREYMAETAKEILDHGTIEPSRLDRLKKSIETAVRRMNEKKYQR